MKRFALSLVLGGSALTLGLAGGCGSDNKSSGFDDGGTGAGTGGNHGGGTGDGGGTFGGDGSVNITGDGSTGTGNGCSAAAQLVYVFDTQSNIYSFDPPSKTFTKIAKADCKVGLAQANSMAIDRNLVAWLNYFTTANKGSLYKFDLNTKTGCAQAVTLPTGFGQVGMGFSTDTSGGTAETLYLDGVSGGGGLGKLNPANNTVTTIGNFGNDPLLSGGSAELTGTGDARLYGYFTTSPNVRVAEIDKTNGNVLSDNELKGFPPPQDWAFSFWGGDFYLYTSDGISNSKVVHYAPGTGALDTAYVPDVGFTIIGAGVSTCAPVTPPH